MVQGLLVGFHRATQPSQAPAPSGAVLFAESTNGVKCTAACHANEKIRSVLSAAPDKMGPWPQMAFHL
ncbi:hypothetical protein [Polaromonas sp. CG9_12]|nr:hypothetical protein [Polaromonas sp. CG9_12]